MTIIKYDRRYQIHYLVLHYPCLKSIYIKQLTVTEYDFPLGMLYGNLNMVEFLLKTFTHSLNPDVRNNNGETPLMFMVKFNNSFQLRNFPLILDLLKESVLLVDSNGKTVLHHIVDTDSKHKRENLLSTT